MLCLSGFELYSRWVPLMGMLEIITRTAVQAFDRSRMRSGFGRSA